MSPPTASACCSPPCWKSTACTVPVPAAHKAWVRGLSLLFLFVANITVANVNAASPITAAAFAGDGRQVVVGSQSGLEVRAWPELTVTGTLPTDLDHVHCLSFSPDGKTLLAAGGSPAEEGAVEVLNWPGGKRVRRVVSHADLVCHVAWSPDGTQWATASADGQCHVYDAASGERLVRHEGHSRAVLSLCFLPDGKLIASAGVDQTLQIWERATGRHVRTLDNHVGTVNAVVAQPGTVTPPVVATISEDRTVRLWQPTIGRLMRFARLPSIPRVIAWSASGGQLFIGCNDGHVRILNADSLEVVRDLPGFEGRIHELLVDPSRETVLIGGEAGVRSMDLKRQ